MKKVYAFAFMIMFLFAVTMVSADTIIAGKIYNSDYSAIVEGANVTVTCDDNVLNVISGADGSYKVNFGGAICGEGDSLSVDAVKGSLFGSSGVSTLKSVCLDGDSCLISVYDGIDLAVVNVPLVPEFGFIIGAITLLSAVAVFFVVRRK